MAVGGGVAAVVTMALVLGAKVIDNTNINGGVCMLAKNGRKKPIKRKRVANPRVPRTHAGNTWTQAGYWSFIRSALRRAFSRYPVKYHVKANAKRAYAGGGRQKSEYQCAVCLVHFPDKDVEVDHIKPCGSLKDYSDLPSFVSTMFCEEDNLRVICKPCHKIKTAEDRKK